MTAALRFLPLALVLALATGLLLFGATDFMRQDRLLQQAAALERWSGQSPIVVGLLLIGLIAGLTAAGLPGAAPMFMAAGFLVGVLPALVVAALGNVVGTSLLYFALRQALFRGPATGPPPRLLAGFQDRPLLYALALRAIPVLPNGAATGILAALRCPWPSFITASALGHLPNAGLLAWIGAQATIEVRAGHNLDPALLTEPRWWLPLALLVLLLAATLFARRWNQARVKVS